MNCPCGSKKIYLECCGSYLEGKDLPKTPLALMRSRYTAYVQENFDYIESTMRGEALLFFNRKDAEKASKGTKWLGLEILEHSEKMVRFIATFEFDGERHEMEEKSLFEKYEGKWFYTNKVPIAS